MNENAPVVLVIEDHEELSALAAYFLRRGNFQVVVASTGLEGLRLARQLSPALILCDACLPQLNGSELLGVLRSNPATAKTPFVMMSGFENARWGSPMPDAFLAKPFQMNELLTLVRAFARPSPTTSWAAGENSRPMVEVA